MDKFDARILDLLQQDGRMSWTRLAERVNLSTSATLRRVQALEKNGIVKGFRAALDAEQLGYEVRAFIEVNIDRSNARLVDEFRSQVRATPEIVSCYMVSGAVDYLLEVVAADLKSYGEFLDRTVLRMKGVKDASSRLVLAEVKSGDALPTNRVALGAQSPG